MVSLNMMSIMVITSEHLNVNDFTDDSTYRRKLKPQIKKKIVVKLWISRLLEPWIKEEGVLN